MAGVVAIDAGTTGVRALAVDDTGTIVHIAYRELGQHFPQPGWVEHDPEEIWTHVRATLSEVVDRLGSPPTSIGITNQRETVVAWDRRTGNPLHRAIVWQDRRTADRCQELRDQGHLESVRATTGLVLDPYFSATKMEWLLRHGDLGTTAPDRLALGTVDTWVLWKLTGGVFATDVTNASRTLLFDIHEREWSDELAGLFGVPIEALPEVLPSCGRFGEIDAEVAPGLAGVPVGGIAGDQQAALFGQACFERGMAKATYGTGSFLLLNTGARPVRSDTLLTTVAAKL